MTTMFTWSRYLCLWSSLSIYLFFVPSSNAFLSSNTAAKWTNVNSYRRSASSPNDLETPEERDQRMELVRQIQKSFYADESGITVEGTCIENLPLWRVQWTELPGYQNVLNCHVPHYTHMFNKVLAGPKPWYFGHVYLPDGSENLDNPEYRLEEGTKATFTGMLMQVSDYRQLDNGCLVLIVQALERFRIREATQHTPYAVANVELLPDSEIVEAHYLTAKGVVADALLTEEHAWGAACASAVTEARHWHPFEFRTSLHEEARGPIGGVSPLVNFDADITIDNECDLISAMKDHLEISNTVTSLPSPPTKDALQLEYEVWVALDMMIRLLTVVNPNNEVQVPIPTQMLGLIPDNPLGRPWPDGFMLDSYASKLKLENAMVGTSSKTPFVRISDVAGAYPDLRRAHRLSFVVWMLLETIVVEGMAATSKQDVLEMGSISKRLEATKMQLDAINYALRMVSEQGPFEML